MRFSIEWLANGQNVAAEERATLCELKIDVGNENACQFLDDEAQEVVHSLCVPAVHLAEGIARDWWWIFGGRDHRHSLLPYRTGFVLPDLRFGCDGSMFAIEGHQMHYRNPGLRFWSAVEENCSRAHAEHALAAFVDEVVDKLDSEHVHCEAVLAWRRVCASRADPDEAAFCEAAGALHIDPYAITDNDAHFIEGAGNLFAGEALFEFLAGGLCGGAARFRYPFSTLDWLGDLRSQRKKYESDLPTLADLQAQFGDDAARRTEEPAWSQGYRVAKMLAKALEVDGRDLPTPEAFATRLGGRDFQRVHVENVEPSIRAVLDAGASVHLRDRGRGKFFWASQAETFALARAVGTAVCLPQTEHRVVNGLHDAEHQAIGRAFAAEFLAPIDKIRPMIADGFEEDEIAHEFKVSPQVVWHQLENQARIAEAQAN